MFVFLILHYLATQDTIECVDSIIDNVQVHNYSIVIVDNGSYNNSYEVLKEKYRNNDRIVVLRSEENIGFAKGNNIGFVYAKQIYNPQYIIMINNDTIIEQADFCSVIDEKYEEYGFAVLGPDIVTKDGIHQNPWIRDGMSFAQLRLFRMKQRMRILLSYIHLDERIYRIIHRNDSRKEAKIGDYLDVPLHGAALVFSAEYIKKHDGLDGRTFLYFEEEILRYHCKIENLLMMYTSDLHIFHKEDVSTKISAKKQGIKERNEYRNRIKSSKEYEKLKKQ